MNETVIKAENIGKLYKLGEIGTGTISHDLNRWWARVRGKEDPFAKIGQTNDRTTKGDSDWVWALKDINFEVKQGEVLGIIGRNGAGKSTLLKILSKVTTPSEGRIKVKGRIASLLEVGTGFHPELTGRENIFLNGAILGMAKAEIRSKFDEIVDFAGVDRYIDTPVKRYSSGMYVRLAFAVAAFLEPEILIVDEVLAVGDAEFQKKCLGRMKDVSQNDGRTVLFVSHNMAAIDALCTQTMLMHQGSLQNIGNTKFILKEYISLGNGLQQGMNETTIANRPGNGWIRITGINLLNADRMPVGSFMQGEDMIIRMDYRINDHNINYNNLHFSINIVDELGNTLVNHTNKMIGYAIENENLKKSGSVEFRWKAIPLITGKFNIDADIVLVNQFIDFVENAASFTVMEGNVYNYHSAPSKGQFAIEGFWRLIE